MRVGELTSTTFTVSPEIAPGTATGRAGAPVGALMLAGASAARLYATTARAIDLTVNDGRATADAQTTEFGRLAA